VRNVSTRRVIPPEEQLRTLKHVYPSGRINLGRRYAFKSFTAYGLPDGRIVLSPAEIMETHQVNAWRRAVGRGVTPPPAEPLDVIPMER
jgi:hypothetical protein